jgi:hypothetical protein
MRVWDRFLLFAVLLAPIAAVGQELTPAIAIPAVDPTRRLPEPRPALVVGVYYTRWQNPFRLTLSTVVPDGAGGFEVVRREVRRIAGGPASPVFDVRGAVGRNFWLGLWHNPVRGERLQTKVTLIPGVVRQVDLVRDVNLTDLHLRYSGPDGLGAQVGYYWERGSSVDQSDDSRAEYHIRSWNLWLVKELALEAGGRPVSVIIEIGYHTAGSLSHPFSLLSGAAVDLNAQLRLAGSLWLFDVSEPSVRLTLGLLYQL